jgi:hypothetical protein
MPDIEELSICPICKKPLLERDAVDYNGESVHRECVPEFRERNPNDSYT